MLEAEQTESSRTAADGENQPADQPMIIARDLRKVYSVKGEKPFARAEVKALAEVSFELAAGKTLAVVGESGCGKSTLARLLTLIESPSGGNLIIDGTDVSRARNAEQQAKLRQTVQIVFQDPYGSLNPRHKVGAILSEPLIINTKLNREQRRAKVQDMLKKVGLRPEHYERYPHMFSGGQRQRIAIARALMLNPKVVVLDEPVSALDVSIQAQVLNLLSDLKEDFNLTFVFISHDLSVVRFIADDVLVMYLGRAVEYGPCERIFDRPQHPYTQALLSARPIADPDRRDENKQRRVKLMGELPSPLSPPPGCLFHPRCPLANSRCANEIPAMQARPLGDDRTGVSTACHAVEEGRER